jgi:hypothetical protein
VKRYGSTGSEVNDMDDDSCSGGSDDKAVVEVEQDMI